MLPKGLLKEHASILSMMLRIVDLLAIFSAAKIAYYFKFAQFDLNTEYASAVAVGILSAAILFHLFHLYASVRSNGLGQHLAKLVQVMLVLSFVLGGFAFFSKVGEHFSRLWFAGWMIGSFFFLVFYRCLMLLSMRFMRSRGLNERRVVIFGAGDLGLKFAEAVQQALWTGFRIKYFIDDDVSQVASHLAGVPVIQTPANLGEYLSEQGIDEVWLALPLHAESRVKQLMYDLRHYTFTMRFVLDIYSLDLLNHSITDVAGFPVLNIQSTPMVGVNRLMKALEDRALAALILLMISPVLLAISVLVKLSSPGPVFYRQKRIGWNGREFNMLKFRSMPVTAEAQSGPVWAKAEDNRATSIGGFLRRTSLDELPQFINVLKGEMSIVGPRPERKVFVDEFKDKVPGYMQKHRVKAGITGWAQVNGWRGNTSLEKRIEFDLYYINNWSLLLDIKIIFLTIFKGFVNRNAY